MVQKVESKRIGKDILCKYKPKGNYIITDTVDLKAKK